MTLIAAVRTTCRLCSSRVLDPVLALGELALPVFRRLTDPPAPTAPLDLVLCGVCGLVQLRHTVDAEQLFRSYWYVSSVNEAMTAELTDVVETVLHLVHVSTPHDLVVDIGANDGFLLSCYPVLIPGWSATRVAFEPARNLQARCRPHADVLVNDFFPAGLRDISGAEQRVKICTAIACFYDVDDPAAFVAGIDRLLHPDGVWVVQLQDLAQMVEATAFDNLCHEHLTYWSLDAFCRLLRECHADLHVVHAERRAINGGSLRLLVRRCQHDPDDTVAALLATEKWSSDWQALNRFAWRTQQAQAQIRAMVWAAKAAGYVVDLYGGSTKGETLTQTCGLGPEQIRQAWERSPDKVGRVTATGIPIVDEATGRADPPDLLVVAIWAFRNGILDREAAYLASGGRMLFPLPAVELVSHAAAAL